MDELALEVDSLDKIPNEFRHLYEPAGDKFKVADTHAPVIGAVNGLNKSLRGAREDAKKVKPVDLSPLADFGSTPAEIKANIQTKLQELQDTIAKTPDQKVALDNLRADMVRAFEGEKKPLEKKVSAYQAQLYTMLVDNQATAAIAELKGVPKLLLPFVKEHVEVVEENGEFSVVVVDARKERRYSGVNGQPMTIKDLVTEMKQQPEFARLFDSEAPQGGTGTPPGPARRPGPAPVNLTSTQKISVGLARNQGRRR